MQWTKLTLCLVVNCELNYNLCLTAISNPNSKSLNFQTRFAIKINQQRTAQEPHLSFHIDLKNQNWRVTQVLFAHKLLEIYSFNYSFLLKLEFSSLLCIKFNAHQHNINPIHINKQLPRNAYPLLGTNTNSKRTNNWNKDKYKFWIFGQVIIIPSLFLTCRN